MSTPPPGAGYVPRDALLQRLDSVLQRRFVLLQAPAGFGKTAALAEFSRRKQDEGLVVAWISLDEEDSPGVFGNYLSYAFACAGLDMSALSDSGDPAASFEAYQIGMLARAIHLHAGPCLLVLDEVDRLPRDTIESVQRLIELGPDNLHLVMSARSNPGLDLALRILDGSGGVVGADACRFSPAEIDRFFEGALSRPQLAEIEKSTFGWPFALLVHKNARAGEGGRAETRNTKLAASFVELRLLRDMSDEARKFLCELAVFDRIATDLVDDVLESGDTQARIAGLSPLDGLLSQVDETGTLWRLHPLVRDYCTDWLALEDPARKRELHAGIAKALAFRGQPLPALNHAHEAGEPLLVGELLETAGVYEQWLRQGAGRLFSAARFLSPEVTAPYPRLLLLHSVVQRMSLKVGEAEALYESAARATDGFTRDREGGDPLALAIDAAFARMVLAGGPHLALDDTLDTVLPAGASAANDERHRYFLGGRHMLLCGASYERAAFDACRRWVSQARTSFGEERPYANLLLDVYEGMAAMAEGHADAAAACYRRARRRARLEFSSDPYLASCLDALTIELDLERNRPRAIYERTLVDLAELRSFWTDIDAVAVAASAELTCERHGAEVAVRLLTRYLEDARAMRSEWLSKFSAGLLVMYLVEVGSTAQAGRVWELNALPQDAAELLDLDGQPWRTMESLACARVRLLAAQGDYPAAADLAARLCVTASERGLRRTELRGLALSMAVAEAAGHPEQAEARLADFLRQARDTGYVKPLLRNREVSRAVLLRLRGAEPDAGTRDVADAMLEQLDGRQQTVPHFSPRELQVLSEVREGQRNKDIAGRLGISLPGVRFHLRNIYRKTGVSRRDDAVRSAEELGVLD